MYQVSFSFRVGPALRGEEVPLVFPHRQVEGSQGPCDSAPWSAFGDDGSDHLPPCSVHSVLVVLAGSLPPPEELEGHVGWDVDLWVRGF